MFYKVVLVGFAAFSVCYISMNLCLLLQYFLNLKYCVMSMLLNTAQMNSAMAAQNCSKLQYKCKNCSLNNSTDFIC